MNKLYELPGGIWTKDPEQSYESLTEEEKMAATEQLSQDIKNRLKKFETVNARNALQSLLQVRTPKGEQE